MALSWLGRIRRRDIVNYDMDDVRRCQLPGCGQALPTRSAQAGRPRCYCCASHRVQAAQLRAIEQKAGQVAEQLAESAVRSLEQSRVTLSKAQGAVELARQIANTAISLEKETAPMVDMRKRAILAMELPPAEREAALKVFRPIGALREQLHRQLEEIHRLSYPSVDTGL